MSNMQKEIGDKITLKGGWQYMVIPFTEEYSRHVKIKNINGQLYCSPVRYGLSVYLGMTHFKQLTPNKLLSVFNRVNIIAQYGYTLENKLTRVDIRKELTVLSRIDTKLKDLLVLANKHNISIVKPKIKRKAFLRWCKTHLVIPEKRSTIYAPRQRFDVVKSPLSSLPDVEPFTLSDTDSLSIKSVKYLSDKDTVVLHLSVKQLDTVIKLLTYLSQL